MDLYTQIRDFLYAEAQLLDERKFREWFDLFEEDSFYYMPCRPDAQREKRHSAFIDEDYDEIKIRVERLYLPEAHTENPTPTAVRSVSNIMILSEEPITVRSKLIMHEFQRRNFGRDNYETFAATVEHGLNRTADGLRIAWKKVHVHDASGAPVMMARPL